MKNPFLKYNAKPPARRLVRLPYNAESVRPSRSISFTVRLPGSFMKINLRMHKPLSSDRRLLPR
jgi:hypothetical protein